MSNSLFCNFCEHSFPITKDTFQSKKMNFEYLSKMQSYEYSNQFPNISQETLEIAFAKCPNCGEVSVSLQGIGSQYKNKYMSFHPDTNAKKFPEYIPHFIREDYEEAYKILNLSPKASATLSRRCIQEMIRDFYHVKEKTLFKEIEAISDKVDPQITTVLNSLRQLGNIGAHSENDVNTIVEIEPGEAEKLLKFIEFLMEKWYINRHETEQLLNDINSINEDKQAARKQ